MILFYSNLISALRKKSQSKILSIEFVHVSINLLAKLSKKEKQTHQNNYCYWVYGVNALMIFNTKTLQTKSNKNIYSN